MTTTQTTIPCQACNDEDAVHDVRAQHLDPDDDGTGRMIGWSKSIWSRLCADCLTDWESDELVGICEVNPL